MSTVADPHLEQPASAEGHRRSSQSGVVTTKRRLGWLGAEFVVVFLGVSVSFAVDDYRSARDERRGETEILKGIASDIDAELAGVALLVDIYQPTSRAGERLYTSWLSLPTIADSAGAVLWTLHQGAPYAPVRAHYETAKSTGQLALIRNETLRGTIASVFEGRQGQLQGLSQFSVGFDFDFFRRLLPYVQYGPSGETEIVPGVRATMPGPVTLQAVSLNVLREDVATRNALYMMAVFRRHLATQLTDYRMVLQQLRAAIDRELLL